MGRPCCCLLYCLLYRLLYHRGGEVAACIADVAAVEQQMTATALMPLMARLLQPAPTPACPNPSPTLLVLEANLTQEALHAVCSAAAAARAEVFLEVGYSKASQALTSPRLPARITARHLPACLPSSMHSRLLACLPACPPPFPPAFLSYSHRTVVGFFGSAGAGAADGDPTLQIACIQLSCSHGITTSCHVVLLITRCPALPCPAHPTQHPQPVSVAKAVRWVTAWMPGAIGLEPEPQWGCSWMHSFFCLQRFLPSHLFLVLRLTLPHSPHHSLPPPHAHTDTHTHRPTPHPLCYPPLCYCPPAAGQLAYSTWSLTSHPM